MSYIRILQHPLPLSQCSREDLKLSAELEAHVNWVVTNVIPPSLTLKEIRTATQCDPVLHDLFHAIKNRQALDEVKFKRYRNVAEELSVVNGDILRGDKIVIPTSLRNKVVKIAHEGHQGLVKTKQFLRSRVWFPKMDETVVAIACGSLRCVSSHRKHTIAGTSQTYRASTRPMGEFSS